MNLLSWPVLVSDKQSKKLNARAARVRRAGVSPPSLEVCMDFDDWVEYGHEQGWVMKAEPCSGKRFAYCATHDPMPLTEEEEEMLEEGEELCLFVIRLRGE